MVGAADTDEKIAGWSMEVVRNLITGEAHEMLIDFAISQGISIEEAESMIDYMRVAASKMRRMTAAECRDYESALKMREQSGLLHMSAEDLKKLQSERGIQNWEETDETETSAQVILKNFYIIKNFYVKSL